jgi:hypothetical protein
MFIELVAQFPLSEALDHACQPRYTHYYSSASDYRLGTRMILQGAIRTQLLLKEFELKSKVIHEGLRDRYADGY